MSPFSSDPDSFVATLTNGIRVVTIRQPQLEIVHISVFVRSGSQHESRALNGISHVVEHMAFKGTTTRNCQRINLDAERLGAEVNAHTDKDHTAFHMMGLIEHTGALIHMLGDIVQNSTFPPDELERERQVILHELAEDEDDALSAAYKLFDKTCFGDHPLARPVIGTRANIKRFTRDQLVAYVHQRYSGANVIVGVIGPVQPQEINRHVEAAFGSMRQGDAQSVDMVRQRGGVACRHVAGSSQTHVLLGFETPTLSNKAHYAYLMASTLFGDGMSSPLMDTLRERLGLAYHASCMTEVAASYGQFVVEVSTSPQDLDDCLTELAALLQQQTKNVRSIDLERACHQTKVRHLRSQQQPARRLETAAMQLFANGHIACRADELRRSAEMTTKQMEEIFRTLVSQPATVAIAGKVLKGTAEKTQQLLTALGFQSQ